LRRRPRSRRAAPACRLPRVPARQRRCSSRLLRGIPAGSVEAGAPRAARGAGTAELGLVCAAQSRSLRRSARRSGTAVAVGGVGGFLSAGVPAALGLLAQQFGLGPTMWVLVLAPLALFALTPRRRG